ncbi:hypothetical protein DAI22_12g058400 [Oryza sativa Japonica Group]|nr:hypothetical protein DAI22_12g058400 [Oryza sativa Japonica Group]
MQCRSTYQVWRSCRLAVSSRRRINSAANRCKSIGLNSWCKQTQWTSPSLKLMQMQPREGSRT